MVGYLGQDGTYHLGLELLLAGTKIRTNVEWIR